jgi:glycosyltransferase involved in cell wall biosynthesis
VAQPHWTGRSSNHDLEETFVSREDEPALAIVIPVWRGEFLGAALDSLRSQTETRFRVYVCDDASLDDVASISAYHGRGLDLVYHRFPSNLGGRDLVAQWTRCVALAVDEPWLWVFADDDVAKPDTVAGFYCETKRRPNARLFCLSVEVIDESGDVIDRLDEPPEEEEAGPFLHALLKRRGREVRGADHIFEHALYRECGGFNWMPQALFSDMATWVNFTAAAGKKIRLTQGGLLWRKHSTSVSNRSWQEERQVYLTALNLFAEWVDAFVDRCSPELRVLVAEEMFKTYSTVYRSLPGRPNFNEGRIVFLQWWGLPNVGGKTRAGRMVVLWARGRFRNLPLVSIWCRWRVCRSASR